MIVPLDHAICEVMFARQALCVEFADGRQLCAPLDWFPALAGAKPGERDEFVIAEDGMSVAWPALGEKVTADFLLALRYGAQSVAVMGSAEKGDS